MNMKKIMLVLLAISFIILLPTSTTASSIQKWESPFGNDIEPIISQVDGEKLFMIGRITNLQIEDDSSYFNPINLWFFGIQENDGVTTWYISHSKNQGKLFHIYNSEFKGILTIGFICGVVKIIEQEPPPTITFQKKDIAYENTLTVVASDPPDIPWSDIELLVDGTPASHGMTGTVIAGQIIDITAIAGTGAYTISIRHIPTNTLIGSYDFADQT